MNRLRHSPVCSSFSFWTNDGSRNRASSRPQWNALQSISPTRSMYDFLSQWFGLSGLVVPNSLEPGNDMRLVAMRKKSAGYSDTSSQYVPAEVEPRTLPSAFASFAPITFIVRPQSVITWSPER